MGPGVAALGAEAERGRPKRAARELATAAEGGKVAPSCFLLFVTKAGPTSLRDHDASYTGDTVICRVEWSPVFKLHSLALQRAAIDNICVLLKSILKLA